MGPVTATILVNDAPVDHTYVLASIDITTEYNRLPLARLTYLDGDPAANEFAISQSGVFNPGARIEIKLRYGSNPDTTLFNGVIVRQSVAATTRGSSLTLEMKDALYTLTMARNSRAFSNQTDAQVISAILGAESCGTIDDNGIVHESMVQYAATDWDFILSRADLNGLLVRVDNGKLNAQPPQLVGAPVAALDFGSGVIREFDLESSAASYLRSSSAMGWAPGQQETITAQGEATATAQSEALPAGLGATAVLESLTALQEGELKAWSAAQLSRNRLAVLRGRIQIDGSTLIKVGTMVSIGGISDLYNGNALATGVRHRVSESGWVTDLQLGLPEGWFTGRPGVSQLPASGMLPYVSGLQTGIIGPPQEDPAGQYRVPVTVPALPPGDQVLWARQGLFDAGNARGAWFQPQQGDEVVLGFFNDDPRQPVILGSLYSSKQPPPTAAITQEQRGFASPKGQVFVTDDSANSITLKTASGQSLVISDSDGLVITSKKDITLNAGEGGTFTVNAQTIAITGNNFKT